MQNVVRSAATRNAMEDTGQMPVMFSGPSQAPPAPPRRRTQSGPDFAAIQRSTEFTALRRRLRGFAFPMSLLFFVWYMAYVLLAAYAHDFMSIKLFGEVNIAIVLGILQFVSTMAITVAYVRFANRHVDPEVARIRIGAGVDQP